MAIRSFELRWLLVGAAVLIVAGCTTGTAYTAAQAFPTNSTEFVEFSADEYETPAGLILKELLSLAANGTMSMNIEDDDASALLRLIDEAWAAKYGSPRSATGEALATPRIVRHGGEQWQVIIVSGQ